MFGFGKRKGRDEVEPRTGVGKTPGELRHFEADEFAEALFEQ